MSERLTDRQIEMLAGLYRDGTYELHWFESGEVDGLYPLMAVMLDEMRFRATELAKAAGYDADLVRMVITSGMRPTDTDSEHSKGMGADIACTESHPRRFLLQAAYDVGFNRVGVYDRHLHVGIGNTINAAAWPQDVTWWGESD